MLAFTWSYLCCQLAMPARQCRPSARTLTPSCPFSCPPLCGLVFAPVLVLALPQMMASEKHDRLINTIVSFAVFFLSSIPNGFSVVAYTFTGVCSEWGRRKRGARGLLRLSNKPGKPACIDWSSSWEGRLVLRCLLLVANTKTIAPSHRHAARLHCFIYLFEFRNQAACR